MLWNFHLASAGYPIRYPTYIEGPIGVHTHLDSCHANAAPA